MKSTLDVVNVVYCCSDLFAEVCAVSMTSLFENNKHIYKINVFLIDDGIHEANKKRICELADKYRRNVLFCKLPNPSEFYNDNRCTIKSLGHTYARMILGDIIPNEVNRIISLDSDTLVLGNIDELWNIDMKNHPIAGVDDCMGRVALVKTQHLKPDSVHCNAGMYLIDLSVWRKEFWTEKFYSYIKETFDNGFQLGGYEEEVINKVMGDRMMILHPKFNLMTLEQVFTYDELMKFRQPIKYYSECQINEAKEHTIITHSTNFFYVKKRMFEEKSDHPMRKQYEKYRSLTPWKDDPAINLNQTFKQRFQKSIWHIVPRKIAISLGRFVRNEVRPLLKRKRDDE